MLGTVASVVVGVDEAIVVRTGFILSCTTGFGAGRTRTEVVAAVFVGIGVGRSGLIGVTGVTDFGFATTTGFAGFGAALPLGRASICTT
jgi:hypothetical protein